MSFETHAVIIQIPAAPERTPSRSEGRMALSPSRICGHLSGTALSFCRASPRRAPGSKNPHVVGGGINGGSLLVRSCNKKKNGLKSISMQKVEKNGTAARRTRGGNNTTAVWQRIERIQLDQNMVFFRIRTEPGTFVCPKIYGMKRKGAFVQTGVGANETQPYERRDG